MAGDAPESAPAPAWGDRPATGNLGLARSRGSPARERESDCFRFRSRSGHASALSLFFAQQNTCGTGPSNAILLAVARVPIR